MIKWLKWQVTRIIYPWRLGNALWELETAVYKTHEIAENRKKYWLSIEFSNIIDWVVTVGSRRSTEEFQVQRGDLLDAINRINKEMSNGPLILERMKSHE